MTVIQAPIVGEVCYKCGLPATAFCDLRRTAYDVCGRACCDAHRHKRIGGQHLCADHDRLIASTMGTTAAQRQARGQA